MKPAISIGKALPDKNLLGAALGDISTWRVWVAVLKATFASETGVVAIIAASREQATTVFNYTKGFLQSAPLLAECIESVGETEIKLKGSVTIQVMTNSYRVARGQTLLAVVGDEVSFWRDESTSLPDWETFRAVQPSLLASGGM